MYMAIFLNYICYFLISVQPLFKDDSVCHNLQSYCKQYVDLDTVKPRY